MLSLKGYLTTWYFLQSEYAQHNDAVLLVIIPAAQAPEVSSAKALRVAKEYDGECALTVDSFLILGCCFHFIYSSSKLCNALAWMFKM